MSASTVEVFYSSRRVASHVRSFVRHGAHHRSRPHARVPPPPRAVDAVAHRGLGREDRAVGCCARGGDPGAPAPPRAGLSLRPRHHPPGRPLRRRALRGGLCAGPCHGARTPTSRSSRSSPTTSTASRFPREPHSVPIPITATSAVAPTTAERRVTMLTHPTTEGLLALEAHGHGPGLRRTTGPSRLRGARLRRTPGAARRPGGHRAGEPTNGPPPASRRSSRPRPPSKTSTSAASGDSTAPRSSPWPTPTASSTTRRSLIVGPTGVGKTYLACALAHAAIRHGHTALYLRAPRMFDEIAIARADGRLARLMATWARVGVLVIDDFLLRPLSPDQAADLLEVIEDRCGLRSTIITCQLPVDSGTRPSATPPSPTPCSTACSRRRTASSCMASRFVVHSHPHPKGRPKRPQRPLTASPAGGHRRAKREHRPPRCPSARQPRPLRGPRRRSNRRGGPIHRGLVQGKRVGEHRSRQARMSMTDFPLETDEEVSVRE